MSWDIIIAIVGSLGGLELLKFLFNRKSHSRVAKAEAVNAEFEVLQKTCVFLQEQLHAKEERFAEQTQLVRRLNSEVLELTQKLSDETLAHRMDECKDYDCPFRQPPKSYTPPRQGETIEEYQRKERAKSDNYDK